MFSELDDYDLATVCQALSQMDDKLSTRWSKKRPPEFIAERLASVKKIHELACNELNQR